MKNKYWKLQPAILTVKIPKELMRKLKYLQIDRDRTRQSLVLESLILLINKYYKENEKEELRNFEEEVPMEDEGGNPKPYVSYFKSSL